MKVASVLLFLTRTSLFSGWLSIGVTNGSKYIQNSGTEHGELQPTLIRVPGKWDFLMTDFGTQPSV